MPAPAKPIIDPRESEIRRFVRNRYGVRGTLALHREAFGMDLIRAPLNVTLAPFFLLIRFFGWLLSKLGAKRAGAWLADRQILLTSDIARRIETDLLEFIDDLEAKGFGVKAPPETIRHEVSRYAEIRNAVSEITTSLIVLFTGVFLFHQATPGIISLAGPLAEMRAHSTAINDFALGNGMGRMWYAMFPVELSPWQVILTGIVLAVIASVVTTFAGLIADPVQHWTGIHRRRIARLLKRIDHSAAEPSGKLEREHLLARVGDISDTLLSLWRVLRG